MEIQELYLRHYGKFENHRIELKPGINIIYGGNETGKSTIHSFVRAMFFGLNRGRGRAAKTDEYQIRQPWETPGAFLGSMRLRQKNEVYRIDRCFDRSARPFSVTCETQGKEFAQPDQAMNALLGGISEAAFMNTVFIPQAHAETDEALTRELQRYMVNSESTLDAQLDVAQALQSLRKRKKQFEQQKKKEEERMEASIEKKQSTAEIIRCELEMLKRQVRDETSAAGSCGGDRHVTQFSDEEEQQYQERTTRSIRVLQFLLLLAGILAAAGAFLLKDWSLRVFLGIFSTAFLLLLFPVHFLFSGKDKELPDEEAELENARNRYVLEEIRNREEKYQKLQDELEELYHSHVRLDGIDTEIAALTLAIDRICELSSEVYARNGGQLSRQTSEILSELTGGAYNRIILDETADVRIHTPSRVLGLHQVSGGTMQQIYFALRMAAGELLCGGEILPLILDETFAMYDDARLEAALRWLKKSGRQVILFTCQNRERDILARIS